MPHNTQSLKKIAENFNIELEILKDTLINYSYLKKEANKDVLTDDGIKNGGCYKTYMGSTYIAWDIDILKEKIGDKQLVESDCLPKEEIKGELLTSTKLGKLFSLSARKVNQILSELGWIDKNIKGWKITRRGLDIGGIEKEDFKSGIPYVVWSNKILNNQILLNSIKEQKPLDDETIDIKHENKENATNYTNPEFREKFEAKIRAADGHYVRSRAEVLIDNWLYMAEIVHAYERKLPIEEDMYCDFYLPNGKVYIEFWGLENEPKYIERKKKKLELYKKYNFNLIELNDEDIANLDDVLPKKLLKFGIESY